jgi:hypothetical protein
VGRGRPNSSSWVGGRVLIVKVMVRGGRQSILAPAELGQGEMNACVNEGAKREGINAGTDVGNSVCRAT